jgi:hypothetical protein
MQALLSLQPSLVLRFDRAAALFVLHMKRNCLYALPARNCRASRSSASNSASKSAVRKAALPAAIRRNSSIVSYIGERACDRAKPPVVTYENQPVFAPMAASADYLEGAAIQRVKRMGDPHLEIGRANMACS